MSSRPAQQIQRFSLWFALLLLALSACQPRPEPEPPAPRRGPADWPGFDYAAAAAAGGNVYRLDPQATRIEVVARRDGPLARFGHDHVVSVGQPEGYLQLDDPVSGSRADLRFRPDRLVVDSRAARARHGLDTEPDTDAIEGTRTNLMSHVLDADRWPWATLRLRDFRCRDDHCSALLVIAINGSDYEARQPFRLNKADARVVAEGYVILRQTELGIVPFSALGGGLRVADPLEIHFHIEGGHR